MTAKIYGEISDVESVTGQIFNPLTKTLPYGPVPLLRRLLEAPSDPHGYANAICFTVATLDRNDFPSGTFRPLLTNILTLALQCAPKIEGVKWEGRLGGDGTIGGLTGSVDLWATVHGVAQAMAGPSEARV